MQMFKLDVTLRNKTVHTVESKKVSQALAYIEEAWGSHVIDITVKRYETDERGIFREVVGACK